MKNKDIGLYARIIAMVITTAISIAALLGYNVPVVEENTMVAVIAAVLTVLVNIWNHWKNNNYTIEARTSQKILDQMKSARTMAGSANIQVDADEHEVLDPPDPS